MLNERLPCLSNLTVSTASERIWDIVVLGAGVAGASFASMAAEGGMSVLLVEAKEFPREKVCGGCLNRRAQTFLRERGLLASLLESGAVPIASLHVQLAKHSSNWSVPPMLSVRRSTLDRLLVQDAIEQGACYLSETKGTVEPLEIQDSPVQQESSPTHRTVQLQSPSSSSRDTVLVRSRMVVVATGLSRSALPRSEVWPATQMESSRIGVHTLVPSDAMEIEKELEAKAKRREPTLHMLVGTIGYLGVCKTDGDQWDFAAAIDPDQVRRFGSIPACVRSILKENGLTNTAFLERFPWQSTPYLTRTSDCVARNGIFLLGDATGYVEPFTGEGMSWAFAGASSLHQITCNASHAIDRSAAEQAWNRWVTTAHRSRQKSSRWVANQSRDLARARFVLRACDWLPPLKHLLLRKIMT